MPNYWPGFWSDIEGAIAAVWPEVAHHPFRAVNIERINWQSQIQKGALTAPWVVIRMAPPAIDPEWGADNDVYRAEVHLFYIVEAGGSADTPAALEARLYAMQQYLLTTVFSTLQVLDMAVVDVTETNEVTAQMQSADLPYAAGALGFVGLVGETEAAD